MNQFELAALIVSKTENTAHIVYEGELSEATTNSHDLKWYAYQGDAPVVNLRLDGDNVDIQIGKASDFMDGESFSLGLPLSQIEIDDSQSEEDAIVEYYFDWLDQQTDKWVKCLLNAA
jgi:hypothetical protein